VAELPSRGTLLDHEPALVERRIVDIKAVWRRSPRWCAPASRHNLPTLGRGTPPPQPLRFQTQDVVAADGTVEALQSQLADGLHLYQLFHHSQQAQRNEDLAGLGLAAETGG
jgi:hypothetical protein